MLWRPSTRKLAQSGFDFQVRKWLCETSFSMSGGVYRIGEFVAVTSEISGGGGAPDRLRVRIHSRMASPAAYEALWVTNGENFGLIDSLGECHLRYVMQGDDFLVFSEVPPAST